MTELKTLKDIPCTMCGEGCNAEHCKDVGAEEHHDVDVGELRADAIKDVNEIMKAVKEGRPLNGICLFTEDDKIRFPDWRAHLLTLRAYVMWKNNLSEADLE